MQEVICSDMYRQLLAPASPFRPLQILKPDPHSTYIFSPYIDWGVLLARKGLLRPAVEQPRE